MPFISKRKLNALLTAQHTAGFERGLAQGLAMQDRDQNLFSHVTPTPANRKPEGGR